MSPHIPALPDRTFRNFRALKTVDQRILCSLETSIDRLGGFQFVKCLVGLCLLRVCNSIAELCDDIIFVVDCIICRIGLFFGKLFFFLFSFFGA